MPNSGDEPYCQHCGEHPPSPNFDDRSSPSDYTREQQTILELYRAEYDRAEAVAAAMPEELYLKIMYVPDTPRISEARIEMNTLLMGAHQRLGRNSPVRCVNGAEPFWERLRCFLAPARYVKIKAQKTTELGAYFQQFEKIKGLQDVHLFYRFPGCYWPDDALGAQESLGDGSPEWHLLEDGAVIQAELDQYQYYDWEVPAPAG